MGSVYEQSAVEIRRYRNERIGIYLIDHARYETGYSDNDGITGFLPVTKPAAPGLFDMRMHTE